MKIKELLGFDDGMPVIDLTARCVAAFEAKEGESQYGPWKVNTIILKVPGDAKSLIGELVFVNSFHGTNGWVGAKVKDNEFQGVTTKQLDIKGDGPGIKVIDEDGKPMLASTQTTSAPTAGKVASGGPTTGISEAEVLAATTRYVAHFRNLGFDDTAAIAACTNTLVIALTQGRVYADTVPTESIPDAAPTTPSPGQGAAVSGPSHDDGAPPIDDEDLPF